MAWLKRNLIFVISGVVALGVLAYATMFMMSKKELNESVTADLQNKQSEWNRLNQKDPHPGTDSLDNIAAAKEEQEKVTKVLEEARKRFTVLAATNTVDNATFKKMLDDSLYELSQQAQASGVETPPDFAFTFTSQRNELRFPEASLSPLKLRLEDIKDICDVLYEAKVHAISALKRPTVIDEDSALGAQDYHSDQPVTNSLAIITPYEVTFKGFTSEVAAVLHGVATSDQFMSVKWMKSSRGAQIGMPQSGGAPYGPGGMDPDMAARYGISSADPMSARYGGGRGGEASGRSSAPNYAGSSGRSSAPSYQGGTGAAGGSGTDFRDAYGTSPGAGRNPQTSAYGTDPYGGAGRSGRSGMESAYGAGAAGTGRSRGGRGGARGRGGADPYGGRYGQQAGTGVPGYGAQPGYPQAGGIRPGPTPGKPETILDEEPLSITMRIEVIRLLDESMKNSAGGGASMGGGVDPYGMGPQDPMMMNQPYPMNY